MGTLTYESNTSPRFCHFVLAIVADGGFCRGWACQIHWSLKLHEGTIFSQEGFSFSPYYCRSHLFSSRPSLAVGSQVAFSCPPAQVADACKSATKAMKNTKIDDLKDGGDDALSDGATPQGSKFGLEEKLFLFPCQKRCASPGR